MLQDIKSLILLHSYYNYIKATNMKKIKRIIAIAMMGGICVLHPNKSDTLFNAIVRKH